MDAFKVIEGVCEHAQSSGLIKNLKSAEQVAGALRSIAAMVNELALIKKQCESMQKELDNN